jgi:M6 family metalloprotease-like protein
MPDLSQPLRGCESAERGSAGKRTLCGCLSPTPPRVPARSAIFGERLQLPQERGDRVELIVFGDEFYARYETPSGYTAIYDPALGRFTYAQLASGHLVSTGVPVEKPPPPGLRTHLREDPEVRNARFTRRYDELRPQERLAAGGGLQTFGVQGGLLEGRRLSQGQIRGLTILVDFPDLQSAVTAADVDALLNQPGYSANGNRGSVRDYFLTVSGGKLDYRNTVVGPIRLSRPQSFYERTSFVREALPLAVQAHNLDLAEFDARVEGIIDGVNFMYAGRTVYKGALWPHNGVEEIRFANGMRTHFYMLTSLGRERVDLSIGTFCHETGHLLLRAPDQYDYAERDGDFEASAGIGRYCLMGSGNHLGSGRAPAAICAYIRDLLDWPTETVLLNQPGRYELRQGDYARVYKYETNHPNEYFLLENRTRAGIDSQLPASGLAVYHCDTLGSNEWEEGTAARHYALALLQADGSLDLETNRNNGDGGDLYGAVAGLALGDATVPNSRLWDGSSSGLSVSGIGAPGAVIGVTVGTATEPRSATGEVKADMLIPDATPAGIASAIELAAAGTVTGLEVAVDITHSYIGDLRVVVASPTGKQAVLHNRTGVSGDDIRATYRSDTVPALAALAGEPVRGPWTLRVSDSAARDVGRLNSWRIAVEHDAPEAAVERTSSPNLRIPDADQRGVEDRISIPADGTVQTARVKVSIAHSFRGDLVVELISPSAVTALLHSRQGAGADDLNATFDETTTPALARLRGQPAGGDWTLRVRDVARQDVGMLKEWTLSLDTG